jgi:hypothetical protein
MGSGENEVNRSIIVNRLSRFVRLESALISIAVAAFVSCTQAIPRNLQTNRPVRGPAITGRADLLSPSDLESLLVVGRRKLVSFAPSEGIFRVEVIASSKVYAYYGDFYAGRVRHLVIERMSGEWHVAAAPRAGWEDRFYKADEEDAIIVPGNLPAARR